MSVQGADALPCRARHPRPCFPQRGRILLERNVPGRCLDAAEGSKVYTEAARCEQRPFSLCYQEPDHGRDDR